MGITIDVSGKAGQDGRDGVNYAGQTASRAQRGRAGGAASEPSDGQNAGNIRLALAVGRQGQIELSGRTDLPSGRSLPIQETTAMHLEGYLELLARGGPGGKGADGGDGEDGGRGTDGSDASQWRNGEDGSPGADGGPGGHGTSGARGGNGGDIRVQVAEDATHLLMLVKHDVQAGQGGPPGHNGKGGAGGRGGRGGDAYSWTTTETQSDTDAQGNPQTRTVHHHHRNPGGTDGRRGADGPDGHARLRPGDPGREGSFRILVHSGQQTSEYDRCFDLTLVDYDLQLDDTFAEPTSEIRVRRMVIENSGGMPTPSHQPIVFHLQPTPWIQPLPSELRLTTALDPGQRFTFEGDCLLARIADYQEVPESGPLRAVDEVQPLAMQTGIDRRYTQFQKPKSFAIAFPCEIDAVHSLVSQTPGQAALVRITVSNRSRHDLGRQSEGRRALVVWFGLTDSQCARDLMLLGPDGEVIDGVKGLRQEIGFLKAGSSATVEAIVGVLWGAAGYAQANLAAILQLGERERPEDARDRQRARFPLRVAQDYDWDPAAEVLFIANHATTRGEYLAWQQLAESLGKKLNAWDISLEHALALSARLDGRDSLLRDFHGKSIVLSNGAFQTLNGLRHADQYLGQVDLIRALESHEMRLLVLNEQSHDVSALLQQRLVPTDNQIEYYYRSVREYLANRAQHKVDALLSRVEELVERPGRAARPDPLRQTSCIKLYGVRGPSLKRLRRQAQRLQRKLERDAPGTRVVVTYRLPADPGSTVDAETMEFAPRDGWFFQYVPQGSLTILPTVGDAWPNIVVLPASDAELHSEEFVLGATVRAAVLQTLHFHDKVQQLDLLLQRFAETPTETPPSPDDMALGEAVVDSLLIDLVAEQDSIQKFGWRPLLFGATLTAGLSQLQYLVEYPFTLIQDDGSRFDAQLAARLLAGLRFIGKTRRRWHEHWVWPWSWWRRGPALRKRTRQATRQLRENLFGSVPRPEVEERIRGRFQELWTRFRSWRARHPDAARRTLFQPLQQHAIVTDLEASLQRVMHHDQWRVIQQAEDQREAARVALQQQKEQQRAEYLLVDEGRLLPHVEGALERAARVFCGEWEARKREGGSRGA